MQGGVGGGELVWSSDIERREADKPQFLPSIDGRVEIIAVGPKTAPRPYQSTRPSGRGGCK